jgi:hypothetical protein
VQGCGHGHRRAERGERAPSGQNGPSGAAVGAGEPGHPPRLGSSSGGRRRPSTGLGQAALVEPLAAGVLFVEESLVPVEESLVPVEASLLVVSPAPFEDPAPAFASARLSVR